MAPHVHLLLERQQHPLLATAAVEVAALRAVARAGVDQRIATAHVLRTGGDVDAGDAAPDRVVALGDRDLHVDLEPAEGVHGVAEALEVDAHVVADVEAVQLAQQGLQRVEAAHLVVRAAPEVGAVAVLRIPGVDLAPVDAAPDGPGVGRHRHVDRVARHLEHRDLARLRVDRGDDQGVGVEERLAAALVDADEQDVQALLAVPRGELRRDRALGAALRRLERGGGLGRLVARGRRLGGRVGLARVRSLRRRVALRVIGLAEHAVDQVVGQHVVARDGDVRATEHDQDRQQAGDRQRAQRQLRLAEVAAARRVDLVEVAGDVPRVDGGDDAVDQDQDVDDEDAGEHLGLDDEAHEVQPVDPDEDPAGQGDQQERQRGEGQRPRVGARVGVAEPGEDQGEEGRRERGSRAGRLRPRRALG